MVGSAGRAALMALGNQTPGAEVTVAGRLLAEEPPGEELYSLDVGIFTASREDEELSPKTWIDPGAAVMIVCSGTREVGANRCC